MTFHDEGKPIPCLWLPEKSYDNEIKEISNKQKSNKEFSKYFV